MKSSVISGLIYLSILGCVDEAIIVSDIWKGFDSDGDKLADFTQALSGYGCLVYSGFGMFLLLVLDGVVRHHLRVVYNLVILLI